PWGVDTPRGHHPRTRLLKLAVAQEQYAHEIIVEHEDPALPARGQVEAQRILDAPGVACVGDRAHRLSARKRPPAFGGVEYVRFRERQADIDVRTAAKVDLPGCMHRQSLAPAERAIEKARGAELLDALNRRGERERGHGWFAEPNVL